MFIFLSKFLPPFVYPLGLACILIVAAIFLWRRAGWQRAILIMALLLLLLSSNRWVALGLARSLEWRYLPPADIPDAQVVVLLGGGTRPKEFPRQLTEVGDAGDRVLYAAWLYKQGKADAILSSGGLMDWSAAQSTPAQDMADLLELMGVPRQDIWLQPESHNTYEDALYSAQLLKEKGIRRALLVTSAFHMPRAVRLFEAQGIEVVPLPADFSVTEPDAVPFWERDLRSQVLGLLPSADYLVLTTRMLKEYIGILVYDLKGWQ
jgi:uncharacterized SAM-binding protein YcdF (DUF218 family)